MSVHWAVDAPTTNSSRYRNTSGHVTHLECRRAVPHGAGRRYNRRRRRKGIHNGCSSAEPSKQQQSQSSRSPQHYHFVCCLESVRVSSILCKNCISPHSHHDPPHHGSPIGKRRSQSPATTTLATVMTSTIDTALM